MRIRWKNVLIVVVIAVAVFVLNRHWGAINGLIKDLWGDVSRLRSEHEHFDALFALMVFVAMLLLAMRILTTRAK